MSVRAHGARTCSVRDVYFARTNNVRAADFKSAFWQDDIGVCIYPPLHHLWSLKLD